MALLVAVPGVLAQPSLRATEKYMMSAIPFCPCCSGAGLAGGAAPSSTPGALGSIHHLGRTSLPIAQATLPTLDASLASPHGLAWGGVLQCSNGAKLDLTFLLPHPPPCITLSPLAGQPKVSPTVYLFPPSSDELSTQSKATLVCLLGDFYPGAVQVTWTADGRTLSSGVETSQPQRQTNNQYMASSYLTLSAADWKSHETYACKVTHETGTIKKVLTRSECS
ncbi:uncharacterized protein LOC126040484 [Accipiter gentilis]|uniref:uncharacterized protein LOC126040484 n=1 Tax=Astur gentilis TaxID=8957 RepID=UPI00210FC91E|nr:uncharacterized protein LOC126040484 [Accipiter gentilis]